MAFSHDKNMKIGVTLNLNCVTPVVQGELDLFWDAINVWRSLVMPPSSSAAVLLPAADTLADYQHQLRQVCL
jgi:hypothetical protein